MELNEKIMILSINSMHFSEKNLPSNDPEGGARVITWINQKLAQARTRKMKVLLTYHLPHGSITTPLGTLNFWIPKYNDLYMPIIKKYSDIIAGVFTGHIHISGLAVYITENIEMMLRLELEQLRIASYYGGQVMNRAISPNLGNNPGFTLYWFNENIDYVANYKEYTFDVVSSYHRSDSPEKYWSYLYDSKEDLGLKNLSAEGINEFLQELEKDANKFLRYMMFRLGKNPSKESLNNTISKILRIKGNKDPDGYETCANLLMKYAQENNY